MNTIKLATGVALLVKAFATLWYCVFIPGGSGKGQFANLTTLSRTTSWPKYRKLDHFSKGQVKFNQLQT